MQVEERHSSDIIRAPLATTSGWFAPAALSLSLVVAYYYNGLLFHTLAELSSVTISVLAAVIAWQTYGLSRNHFVLYLATGYFWIAVGLDLVHTLLFRGMTIYPSAGGEAAAQLWAVARLAEAVVLLTAPLVIERSLGKYFLFGVFGLLTLGLNIPILRGLFPSGWTDGVFFHGLILPAVLAGAFLHVTSKRRLLAPPVRRLVQAALLVTVLEELLFVVLIEQSPSLVGHLLKLLSYWLVFLAVVHSTLVTPLILLREGANTFEAIPDPTVVVDERGVIQQTNRAARRLIGGRDGVGEHCHGLFHSPRLTREQCPVCRRFADCGLFESLETSFAEGRWFQVTLSPISFTNGRKGIVHLAQDISHRKHLEEQLEAYRSDLERLVDARTLELKAANRELEALSYSVSHDLRTPLRAINGFSHVLWEDHGRALDAGGRDCLHRIVQASQRMGQLIDGLLSVAEVTRRELHCEELDLGKIARDVWKTIYSDSADHRARLEIEEGLVAWGDRELIRLMLSNLLANALKFSSVHNSVIIGLGKTLIKGKETFYVKDNGIGFNMQYSQKLFEPFHRLHGEEEFEGVGIGLALVKRIVQRHGGRVWAEGKIGGGSTVFIVLS